MADHNLVIPEYKIDLLNKNKKVVNKVENIEKIEEISKNKIFNKKQFIRNKFKKKFNKKNNFKKKFNYQPKIKKKDFDNKKTSN